MQSTLKFNYVVLKKMNSLQESVSIPNIKN